MKYRDAITGEFKKIRIRATDELPAGSIIEYSGLSSDIPIGWESYGNNQIKKIAETTPTTGKLINEYSESTTDGYSCNYINDNELKFTVLTVSRRSWGRIAIDYTSIPGTVVTSFVIGIANTNSNQDVVVTPGIDGIGTQYNIVTGVHIGGPVTDTDTYVNIGVFYK